MKKILTTIVAVIAIAQFSYAQWSAGPGPIHYNDGNVGIGTSNPTTALQLGEFNGTPNQLLIPGTYNFEQIRLGQISNGNSALEFVNHTGVADSYGVKLLVDVDHGSPGLQFQYASPASSYSSLNYSTGLYMNLSGNIGVGTIDSHGYKLAVNGSVIANSMTVKLYADWPDYVFRPTYKLMPLADVKTYIDKNHHLPELPSEAEVIKDGVNLGEMVKIQTKKIEELTLYLIEKDAELKELKTSQQKQMDELRLQIATITKAAAKN